MKINYAYLNKNLNNFKLCYKPFSGLCNLHETHYFDLILSPLAILLLFSVKKNMNVGKKV